MIPGALSDPAWVEWARLGLSLLVWPIVPITLWHTWRTWPDRMGFLMVFGVVYGGMTALGMFAPRPGPLDTLWAAFVPLAVSAVLYGWTEFAAGRRPPKRKAKRQDK